MRAWYRMLYSGRLLYIDFHPGNFLFMDDNRLGIIDFGFVKAGCARFHARTIHTLNKTT